MPYIALLAILGCGSPEGPPTYDQGRDPAATDDTGPTPEEEAEALKEFACDGALPVFDICPCDVEVDWSRLTEDMFGEPVQPDAFERLGWARSTSSSVEDVLDDACDEDSLLSSSTTAYADQQILGATSASLSDMSFLGSPADPPELGRTYWLLWSADTSPGVGTRMVALVSVVEDGADSIEIVWP